ncbi:MAG TPA: DUF58 domain-containing protein [Bdellovibrionales bacterium]|nr:DUF58 domain-containing protein [Bdellovibrionales bacterium]
MSLPPELLKKIKLLEISTRRKVNNMFIGEYHSAFKGQGMTFSEFREYVSGDDVRSIAWPLTARTGKVYIKKYDEEREMTVILAVDVSGSQDFGSSRYFKGEVAAHVAALLSFTAVGNKDAVGLLLFSDQVELFVPPKKGRGQAMRLLRDLYYHKPASRGTDIAAALDHLQGALKKKAHIFIISDFMGQGFESSLRRLSKKHDTAAVVLEDKLEREIPSLGLVDFEDPETGETVCVDTSSPVFKREYKAYLDKMAAQRALELKRAQVDQIFIPTDGDIVTPLLRFFQRRSGR